MEEMPFVQDIEVIRRWILYEYNNLTTGKWRYNVGINPMLTMMEDMSRIYVHTSQRPIRDHHGV
jgi:hypothetical protein